MERRLKSEDIMRFRERLIEAEKSKATVEKYLRDLKRFSAFVNGRAVTKELVIEYKTHLEERYKPASVNSMVAAMNCFFREMDWPECRIKALKVQRQVFRAKDRELTKEDYFRLLNAARGRQNMRLYLLMQTICATGIRVSELRFITVEALQNGWATVSLKGKTRVVLLPTALCAGLKQYAKKNGIRNGSVFVTRKGKPLDRSNILHEMKKLCAAADVDSHKVFPHNLRHLFACIFYQSEKDLGLLADLLGHSNINTTRIYTSLSGEEQIQKIERLGLVMRDNSTT